MKRRASQFPYLTALAVAAVLLATSALASARPSHVDLVSVGHGTMASDQPLPHLLCSVVSSCGDNLSTSRTLY